MLSIAAMTGGPAYYLSLSNISYYADGGEPLPLWAGTAAHELGLSGVAEKEHVERLCAGFHHETGKPLVRNAGEETRNPGHDNTFSASKSVSVLWAMADENLRAKIQQAQESAVRSALKYLEDKAGFARVGAQGQRLTKCPLLFALFEHGTSRAKDPQLHTHALLINLTVHPAGATGKQRTTAIDSTYIYHLKISAGAIYRAALAQNMKLLGFEVEQRKLGASIGFEIKGIPQKLIDEFSKRRAEIEQELKLRCGGLDTATYKYAELVCKETRRKKDEEVSRADLFAEWQKVGREHGVDAAYVRGLIRPERPLTMREVDQAKEAVWKQAVESLSEQHSHWNEADLTKAVAEHATGRLTVKEIRELIANKLRVGVEMCSLGTVRTEEKSQKQKQYVERHEMRYTTPEILRLEREMMRDVERHVRGSRTATPEKLIDKVIEHYLKKGGQLDEEQMNAVKHLTSGPSIRLMTGRAGTGKTTTLKAAVDVWLAENKHRQIYGIAVAGAAMQRLVEGVGKERVKGLTMQQATYHLEKGWLKLDRNSVLIVDEAGMVGTKDLAKIIKHVADARARLVAVGDAKQLQPIDAGGPFKFLEDVLGSCVLKTIRRQKEFWAREAVAAMYEGRADDAIYKYIEAGRFSCSKTREEAMGKLLEQWRKDGGVENPRDVFLIAALNTEVRKVNELAQLVRLRDGRLDKEQRMFANDGFLYVGDRVMFQERSKKMGIENSDTATILSIDEKRQRVVVSHDRTGKEIEVDFKSYSISNCKLGYCSTVHKAQGASLPVVHVLLGGPLTDLHMGYVSLSRSIESSHIFTDEQAVGDPAFSDLLRSLSRERQKTMAIDVEHQQKKQQERELQKERQPSLRRMSINF